MAVEPIDNEKHIYAKVYLETNITGDNFRSEKSIYLIYSDFTFECILDGIKKLKYDRLFVTIELNYQIPYKYIGKIKTIIKRLYKDINLKDNLEDLYFSCSLDYLYASQPKNYLENLVMVKAINTEADTKLRLNKLFKCIDFDSYTFINIASILMQVSDLGWRVESGDEYIKTKLKRYHNFYVNNQTILDRMYEKFWYGKDKNDFRDDTQFLIGVIEQCNIKHANKILEDYIIS